MSSIQQISITEKFRICVKPLSNKTFSGQRKKKKKTLDKNKEKIFTYSPNNHIFHKLITVSEMHGYHSIYLEYIVNL